MKQIFIPHLMDDLRLYEMDLIWVSEVEAPFTSPQEYQGIDGSWTIPCRLCMVTEVYYSDNSYKPWGVCVYDPLMIHPIQNPEGLVGVHVEDIVQNMTFQKRTEKLARNLKIYYKHHYQKRVDASNVIKDTYIKHYWNPTNPNMYTRLLRDWEELTTSKEYSK